MPKMALLGTSTDLKGSDGSKLNWNQFQLSILEAKLLVKLCQHHYTVIGVPGYLLTQIMQESFSVMPPEVIWVNNLGQVAI